ncbi:hypothetical protein SprV_0501999100 [Sparganum proliferum]
MYYIYTRIKTECTVCGGVPGPHGIGGCKNNGLLSPRTCTEHNRITTSIFFGLLLRKKAIWTHPRSRRWQLLDYVLVRSRDRQNVMEIKVICETDGWMDHRLVIIKMRPRLLPCRRPQDKRSPSRLNIDLLSFPAHHLSPSNKMTERLEDPLAADAKASVESQWRQLRDAVHLTALGFLGTDAN